MIIDSEIDKFSSRYEDYFKVLNFSLLRKTINHRNNAERHNRPKEYAYTVLLIR
jgi:hypothetical protein